MDLGMMQTIVGGICGGSLMGMIEFLIRRHDDKKNQYGDILNAIQRLDEKINTLDRKIDSVDAKGDERNTVSARVRLLRFEDELQEEKRHSKDSWDQAISDADIYENYCEEHPSFKNGQTEATIKHIRDEYAKRLEKRDWGFVNTDLTE